MIKQILLCSGNNPLNISNGGQQAGKGLVCTPWLLAFQNHLVGHCVKWDADLDGALFWLNMVAVKILWHSCINMELQKWHTSHTMNTFNSLTLDQSLRTVIHINWMQLSSYILWTTQHLTCPILCPTGSLSMISGLHLAQWVTIT